VRVGKGDLLEDSPAGHLTLDKERPEGSLSRALSGAGHPPQIKCGPLDSPRIHKTSERDNTIIRTSAETDFPEYVIRSSSGLLVHSVAVLGKALGCNIVVIAVTTREDDPRDKFLAGEVHSARGGLTF
jgi:hypothetical protein